MPGGWTMSMAWMRMPGQTWPEAAASFLGMWIVMMAAMMLPSLVSMLTSYRRCLRERGASGLGGLTIRAGAAYMSVWTAFGIAVYPLGVALAAAEMRWPPLARSVPLLTGLFPIAAGVVQLTAWKARHLERCRGASSCEGDLRADARGAWSHGLRLGRHCGLCCSGLIAALLAAGVMDLRAMALVTVAITAERVASRPEPLARAAGAMIIVAGLVALARAALAA